MISYRFLLPAEEEMTEAAVFYEAASPDLGADFLDDAHRGIDVVRAHPAIGQEVGRGLRRLLLHRFPFSYLCRGSECHPDRCSSTSEQAA